MHYCNELIIVKTRLEDVLENYKEIINKDKKVLRKRMIRLIGFRN